MNVAAYAGLVSPSRKTFLPDHSSIFLAEGRRGQANFVAQGDCSPGLRAALVDREREIRDITGKLFEARPDSLRMKLRNIRALVESRMNDIRAMLNSDPARVRDAFAKHIEKITMTPNGEHYVASGTWHLVGRGSIDGAGGPAWTERLPVRFEWLAAA